MIQAAKTARTGIQWACLWSRRPMSAVIAKPASGRIAMSGMSWSQVGLVQRHRFIASYSSTSGVCLLR